MSNSRQLDKCDDNDDDSSDDDYGDDDDGSDDDDDDDDDSDGSDDDDDDGQLADFNTIVDLNHTWLSRSRYGFHRSRLLSSMSLFVLFEELF
jgi:hypothetical protein